MSDHILGVCVCTFCDIYLQARTLWSSLGFLFVCLELGIEPGALGLSYACLGCFLILYFEMGSH